MCVICIHDPIQGYAVTHVSRATLLSTLMLQALYQTTSSEPFRTLKPCLFVYVCEDNAGVAYALMNNKLTPVNEWMDGEQAEEESEHFARQDRLTL